MSADPSGSPDAGRHSRPNKINQLAASALGTQNLTRPNLQTANEVPGAKVNVDPGRNLPDEQFPVIRLLSQPHTHGSSCVTAH